MAKYVCDFDTVKKVGQDIIQAANNMNTSAGNYSSKINTDLAGWNGSAKTSFITQCNNEVTTHSNQAKELIEFGEFIVKTAQSIEDLDNSLSSITI